MRRFLAMTLLVAAVGTAAVRAADGLEMLPEVESAIARAQRALLSQQNPDGSFRGQETVANTALALMAFMVQGSFPQYGEHGDALDRGIQYLLKKNEQGNGYMHVIPHGMYEHALATLALSEAWGMSLRPDLGDKLKQAVSVIVRAQSANGGWRYKPVPGEHDLSVAAIVLVALLSARESGIAVPAATIERGLAYVKSCQEPASGGYGYQYPRQPGLGRTGAGTLVRLIAGQKGTEIDAGLKYIRDFNESKFKQTDFYFYAHYYCALAMYLAGDADYLAWYPQIRDALLARQRSNGMFGSVWETGYAALILGIPYRYIPIYQRTEFEEN